MATKQDLKEKLDFLGLDIEDLPNFLTKVEPVSFNPSRLNNDKELKVYKYDNKCARCGWGEKNTYTNTIPLEIEHIDGNYRNNKEDNLVLLCPNCHSLTSTYKGANLNHGRKSRKKYSK